MLVFYKFLTNLFTISTHNEEFPDDFKKLEKYSEQIFYCKSMSTVLYIHKFENLLYTEMLYKLY